MTSPVTTSNEAPESRSGPGRKPKFSDAELRSRMLGACVEELLRSGISDGLASIRLDRIVLEADVPRGAAYQTWEHPDRSPQEQLRHEAVLYVLESATGNSGPPTREFTLGLINELADEVNSDDIERRKAARREITRQVAKFNHDRLNSDMWKIYRSLATASTTRPTVDPDVSAALERGEERLLNTYTVLFTEFAEILRLKVKPGLSIEHLALAMIALNDGLANHTTETFSAERQRVTLADGQPWTVYAVACEALQEAFFDFQP